MQPDKEDLENGRLGRVWNINLLEILKWKLDNNVMICEAYFVFVLMLFC